MSLPSFTADDSSYEVPGTVSNTDSPPSAPTDGPSVFERFVHNFLNETNIKWLLVLGAAIVFASSLMLVGREFENWPASLKYLTILGYTSALFGAAEIGRLRLGLKTTAQVLHGLTLFLIPICFLSLHWASSSGIMGSRMAVAEAIGLGIPATAFAWFAASRILNYLLRGQQPTYLAAYLILSLAGAMPVIANPFAAFGVALVLWATMSIGTVKINRYLFWMAEENRWPRIFAFFPSLLLGVLFLLTTGLRCAPRMSLEWIGFGCTLVAVPILLTARTVAQVFRQRTGDLVRPLPMSIVLPMFAGLSVLALGIGLSFSHFPRTFALVPSCAVATGLLLTAAFETRHRAFVWASLILVTMTWQFSPTLFRDIALSVSQSAAHALNQQRLPIAFYGITYVPLILGMSVLYRRLNRQQTTPLFAPLGAYSLALTIVLQLVALTHPIAAMTVSVVNVFLFPCLAWLQRRAQVTHFALASMILAAISFAGFWNSIFRTQFDSIQTLAAVAVVGSLLSITRVTDRIVAAITTKPTVKTDSQPGMEPFIPECIGELTGLLLSFISGICWLLAIVRGDVGYLNNPVSLLHVALPLATFVIHTIRTQQLLAGYAFWLLLAAGAVQVSVLQDVPYANILEFATVLLTATSLCGSVYLKHAFGTAALPKNPIEPRTDGELAKAPGRLAAFLIPLNTLSTAVLTAGLIAYHLPMTARLLLLHQPMPSIFAFTISVMWMVGAMFVLQSRLAATVSGCVLPLLGVAIATTCSSNYSLPLFETLLAATITVSISYLLLKLTDQEVPRVCRGVCCAWMIGLALLTLPFFSLEMRFIAVIVLPLLAVTEFRSMSRSEQSHFAILANLHVLVTIPGLIGWPPIAELLGGTPQLLSPQVLQMSFLILLISRLCFQRLAKSLDRDVCSLWAMLLQLAAVPCALMTLFHGDTTFAGLLFMIAGFCVVAITELTEAIRTQSERWVWVFLSAIAVATLWLISNHVFVPGAGLTQLLLLLVAIALLTCSRYSRTSTQLGILSRPFQQVGLVLPTIVAGLAMVKLSTDDREFVQGVQSLAVFGCSGLYFHQWILNRRKGYLLYAGLLVNLAFLCLWKTLQVTDPQFYLVPVGFSILGLVEILRAELPKSSHDPLRYLGALTILVSPVFQILDGSWLHMMSLMVLGVLIVLLSIGLQLKALLFTGTAFIVADLIAMSIRSSLDNPMFLWLGGLTLGISVIALAAFCENHRDRVLARIRSLSALLATWD